MLPETHHESLEMTYGSHTIFACGFRSKLEVPDKKDPWQLPGDGKLVARASHSGSSDKRVLGHESLMTSEVFPPLGVC